MEYVKIKCAHCGKKLLTYDQGSMIRYKSPVKNCKKCGARYADPRCHEMAIEGIPAGTFSTFSYIAMIVIGALILYRGIYLFKRYQLGVPDAMQWLLPTIFVIGGMVMVVGGIVEIIMIKTGWKTKKYARLLQESEQRLSDKNYAHVLKDLGYGVPEKYL